MEIIFKGRQTDVPARFREYATAKLNKLEKLDQKAIRVDVEVSVERNPRQASQKERVELTILSRGPAIRAEAAAEDRLSALDMALAKLDSRLRRALGRRKNHHGAGISAVAATGELSERPPGARPPVGTERPRGASGARAPAGSERPGGGLSETGALGSAPSTGSAVESGAIAAGAPESVVPILMEGDGPLVVRQKFHHAKPISIDQALLEMELVGHDFYLFHDIEQGTPSVVYRRHGYQYGVIRLIEESTGIGPVAESPAGLGARIPSRRRPENGRTRSRQAGAREAAIAAQASARVTQEG
jgi:ribosomal subunit interface protein